MLSSNLVFADIQKDEPLQITTEKNFVQVDIAQKDSFIKSHYASAENRFLQGNVKAAHDDYKNLVSKISHDDYVFLTYARKMAEYGFFDLSEDLILRLDSNLYSKNYIKDIRKFYYPSNIVNLNDILYLADAHASIVYNNLAIETTSELLSSSRVPDNDYKNYLISLGFYKSNNLNQALKYINNAVVMNDRNINYKILKAKILADLNKSKQALKVLKEIKKQEFLTVDFQDKIEEYVLYKVSKSEVLKDYHLAYYYHLQNKSLLAIKVLQSAMLQSKQYSASIFGLLAHIYYENDELLKAQEFAQRAYKEDKKNYLAVLTLADLAYDEKKFELSLKYYKEARKLSEESLSSIGIAKSYIALEKEAKSKKLYEKLLKRYSNDCDLLIGALKVFPQRTEYYLSTVASLDVNNVEVWLGLAKVAIHEKNFVMAETFLNNAYYIDDDNFKYYYYLSTLFQAKGDLTKSKESLKRCSRLNSDYVKNIDLE